MNVRDKNWYVIYTKSRWEKKVHGMLTSQGLESYCPLNRVRKRWSDRMKWVEEPLFKSYVFVRVALDEHTRVRMIPGVLNFVYWLGKPAMVKESEIDAIRRFMGEYSEVQLKPIELKPESRVLILSGALMNMEGKVQRVLQNAVEVVIESLGYKLIAQIDSKKVTPISQTTI